jgi:hypothetical protein
MISIFSHFDLMLVDKDFFWSKLDNVLQEHLQVQASTCFKQFDAVCRILGLMLRLGLVLRLRKKKGGRTTVNYQACSVWWDVSRACNDMDALDTAEEFVAATLHIEDLEGLLCQDADLQTPYPRFLQRILGDLDVSMAKFQKLNPAILSNSQSASCIA